jgi:hypothetical protein
MRCRCCRGWAFDVRFIWGATTSGAVASNGALASTDDLDTMIPDKDERKTTRRAVLTGTAAAVGGYLVAQNVNTDEEMPFMGGGSPPEEVQIMPGKINEQWYYPTIAQFEEEIGEPDKLPALVLTDEGGFVYDEEEA